SAYLEARAGSQEPGGLRDPGGAAHRARLDRPLLLRGDSKRVNPRIGAREMTTERFLNTYRNASTAPSPEVPADLASFMLAADPVLVEAAELARIVARAHQGAATQLVGDDWAHARKYFSLSEKYADWADYRVPAKGFG